MDPSTNDHAFFLLVDLKWHPVGNGEVLALVTSNGSAKGVSGDVIELPRLDLAEVFSQVGVGVGLSI